MKSLLERKLETLSWCWSFKYQTIGMVKDCQKTKEMTDEEASEALKAIDDISEAVTRSQKDINANLKLEYYRKIEDAYQSIAKNKNYLLLSMFHALAGYAMNAVNVSYCEKKGNWD